MMRLALIPMLAVIAACSQQPTSDAPLPASVATAGPSAPPTEPTPGPVPGRANRYTSLEGCKLVREEREEMPYTETLCAGPGGWGLLIADADARQTLSIVAPDKRATPIDLSRVSGGAFNSFGRTAEWRGAATEPFEPDSLVVRFNVAERPYPEPETSYLLAFRLVPTPCLVARVAPGLDQNNLARAAAARLPRNVCML